MGYKDIVFFVETPILKRNYMEYGIAELRELGFTVSIWDLSPMILPTTYRAITADLCDYDECGFKRVFSQQELELFVRSKDKETTLFICSMGYLWEHRKAFRVLKKYDCHFCYYMRELSPADSAKCGRSFRERYNLRNIKNAITRRIPKKFHGVKNADFILGCGGDESAIAHYKAARLCREKCPVYFFHSSNYEDCFINLNLPPLVENPYCVFIDQYLPYHSDLIEEGVQIEPNAYFKEINTFFDLVEELYNVEVIIAAHPRSNYDLHPGVYGKRRIIKNETCRLVKDAKFVIYHFSNSLAYVTLYKKPLLVVTTDAINRILADAVRSICNQLNVSEINLDEFSQVENKRQELDARLSIREDIYADYVKRYMKRDYTGKIEGEALWTQIGKFLMQM